MCLAVFATFGLMGAVGTWLKNAIYAWGDQLCAPAYAFACAFWLLCYNKLKFRNIGKKKAILSHLLLGSSSKITQVPTYHLSFCLCFISIDNSLPFLWDRLRGNDLTAFGIAHGMSFWDHGSRGGTGLTARTISEAFPQLKCTVFDLPHVVANLPEYRNLEFVGGDMFQSVPSADATLMNYAISNSLQSGKRAIMLSDFGLFYVVIPAKDIRTGCPDAPSDGFVSHGVSRSIITLRAAVRNHGRGPWLFVVIACKTRFTLIDDPNDYIRMAHADYPDVLWSGCIMKVVRMSILCQRRLLFFGEEKLKHHSPFLEAVRIGELHHAYP
ncbi:Myricetin O-methyltransferase [Vitis vinifera]|uniref:Myricetin O-methyltransferase n=1 Tax=Vitis vinifera TaxID=29760 RepID=A0A438DR68_VITVI|nr:Myricetin O-methyltransferase [Vitis vinifera]